MAIDTPISERIDLAEPIACHAATAQDAQNDEEISLLDVMIVVAERGRTILWITASFIIVAIIAALLLPIRYTATATLLTPQQNSSLSAQLAAQLGGLGSVAALAGSGGGLLRNPNDMYVGMLRSRTVEDAMIERFGLMSEYHIKNLSDTRRAFERRATVDGSGKDGLIHISVVDRDPRRAAEMANGYVDQFRQLSEHLAITEAGQRRLFFERQLKQANQNLGDAEEALKATQQKTGVIQLDSQARALIESAAALHAQIAAKEVQIRGIETYATGENAQLFEAEQELASLHAQLAKLGGGVEDPDGIIVPKGRMTEAGLEYVRKLRDVKYYETIFDVLARQFELAKLDEAKEGALIQVVDSAVPPDKRSFPKRGLIVIVATGLGLLTGILFAFLTAGFERMRSDPASSRKLQVLRGNLGNRGRL
jgi:tyrosine-protein kinase Etk/Wzc